MTLLTKKQRARQMEKAMEEVQAAVAELRERQAAIDAKLDAILAKLGISGKFSSQEKDQEIESTMHEEESSLTSTQQKMDLHPITIASPAASTSCIFKDAASSNCFSNDDDFWVPEVVVAAATLSKRASLTPKVVSFPAKAPAPAWVNAGISFGVKVVKYGFCGSNSLKSGQIREGLGGIVLFVQYFSQLMKQVRMFIDDSRPIWDVF